MSFFLETDFQRAEPGGSNRFVWSIARERWEEMRSSQVISEFE